MIDTSDRGEMNRSERNFSFFLESDLIEIFERSKKSLTKLSGRSVLVTGAAGFLGRYFIATFQMYNQNNSNPIKIVAIDSHITSRKLTEGDLRRKDPNIEWIYGDAEIGAQLPDNFDYIIHTAGIASPVHYQANPLKTIDVAVNATRALLDKAKELDARVLYFSSSEIYGDPDINEIPTKETYRGNVSSRGPRACYDESKRLGETLCWVYENYYDVHVSVVRPFNIYGPGMLPDDYRVMPNFASSIITGKPIKVYGTGQQTRTFCYITDSIVSMLLILTEGDKPDVFNIGNPKPEISMLNLASIMNSYTELPVEVKLIDYPKQYPKDDPTRRCPDISKLTDAFKFTPKIELEEGVNRFFSWAIENYKYILVA
jgi:UDP-glucuronate decarboxylase